MGVYPTMTKIDEEAFDAHTYPVPAAKSDMPEPQRPYQLDPKFAHMVQQPVEPMCQPCYVPPSRAYTAYEQPVYQAPATSYARPYGRYGSNNCAACAMPLPEDSTYVTANDRSYHHECFRCTKCSDKIHGLKYKLVNGQVECLTCSSPPCDACRRPIEGRQLTAEGRVYHPECFRCNKCDCPLRGEYAINPLNGDRLCKRCDAPQCSMCNRIVNEGESYHCSKDNIVRCVPCARGGGRPSSYAGQPSYVPQWGAPLCHNRPQGYWRLVPKQRGTGKLYYDAPPAHALGPAYGPPKRGAPRRMDYAGRPTRAGPPPPYVHGPQAMGYRRPQAAPDGYAQPSYAGGYGY